MYTALKNAKGFIRYYWFDDGEAAVVPLNRSRNKAGADELMQEESDVLKISLTGISIQQTEISTGLGEAHE